MFTPSTTTRFFSGSTDTPEEREDLETLAKELNPVVGYWDPLGIGKIAKSIDADEQATIGWWRHAEIKHGRVAMAAFVGFCVQSNGIVLPGQLTTSGITYADIAAAGGMVKSEKSKLGTGGMSSKLTAAKQATEAGEIAVIANGRVSPAMIAFLAHQPFK